MAAPPAQPAHEGRGLLEVGAIPPHPEGGMRGRPQAGPAPCRRNDDAFLDAAVEEDDVLVARQGAQNLRHAAAEI
jgi:hypothetical protein